MTTDSLLAAVHAAAQPSATPTQTAHPAQPAEKPDDKPAAAEAAAQAAAQAAQATAQRAADIANLCATAGVPAMAATLIREGATLEQARVRVEGAKQIRAAVELARKGCPQIDANLAETYIAAGTPITQVQSDLFEKMAAIQATTTVRSTHQTSPTGGQPGKAAELNPSTVYAARAKARASWAIA